MSSIWRRKAVTVLFIMIGCFLSAMQRAEATCPYDSDPLSNPVLDPNGQPVSPWCQQKIGNIAVGTASYSAGQFTVTGDGTGHGGTSDGIQFVYQKFTGDFEMIAKVANLTGNPDSETGLMVRGSLAPSSRNAAGVVSDHCPDPSVPATCLWDLGQLQQTIRRTNDADSSFIGSDLLGITTQKRTYLKLSRYKDQISVQASTDGVTWSFTGGHTLTSLTNQVYVGMLVASQQGPGNTATGTFTNVSVKPLRLRYQSSWFGNTLPGGDFAIQQDLRTMYVDPGPGNVFGNSIDEKFAQLVMYDPNGSVVRTFQEAGGYGRGAGAAVTTNGNYVFMGMGQESICPTGCAGYPDPGLAWHCVRRYNMNGSPAPFTSPGTTGGYDGSLYIVNEKPTGEDWVLRGLAWSSTTSRLYVSDTTANVIQVLDQSMTSYGPFPVDQPIFRPRAIAIGAGGSLWIIADLGGDPNNPGVVHYDSAGHYLNTISVTGWKPTGLAIDPTTGLLWVTDDGPDQQVRKFNPDGSGAGTFGDQGGIYSGIKGEVKPMKFNGPQGIGFDTSGRIYVASDGPLTYKMVGVPGPSRGTGTELRKFEAAGTLAWEKLGLEFIDGADADPATDGNDLFSKEVHYTMDYSQPAGRQWTYKGFTLDGNVYPDDMRLFPADSGGPAGVLVRRYQNSRFMFLTGTFGLYFGIYRFGNPAVSETAVPCSVFRGTDSSAAAPWPPASAPTGTRWIWRDKNNNGRMDDPSVEYEADSFTGTYSGTFGWSVDASMNVWTATGDVSSSNPAIRKYRFQGLDSSGCPAYTPGDVSNYPKSYFATAVDVSADPTLATMKVQRAYYVPASDTMYVGLYSPTNPKNPSFPEFGFVGTEIRR